MDLPQPHDALHPSRRQRRKNARVVLSRQQAGTGNDRCGAAPGVDRNLSVAFSLVLYGCGRYAWQCARNAEKFVAYVSYWRFNEALGVADQQTSPGVVLVPPGTQGMGLPRSW